MPAATLTTIVALLGPVAIGDRDAGPSALTPVPGLLARRLLASLATAAGRTRSAQHLIDDVWGDDAPRSPTSALHTQISRLRALLGSGHIEASGAGYRLAGVTTDLAVVVDLAESDDPADLDRAIDWWRGAPGDDLGDGDLADDVRRRADQVRTTLDRRRVTVALARGDHATARSVAESLCQADPLDETAHLDLMRALAAEGRLPDALAVFARLRRALSGELGVDPGAAITAFHAELLNRDGAAPIDATPPATPRRVPAVGLRADTTALVGRDDDVAAILRLVDAHRLVTVQGPGGVGKTRIAQRLGRELSDAGRPVYFVALASVRDDEDVLAAIASTLGVGEVDLGTGARPRIPVGDLEDRLADELRGNDAVVILDNCEQVIDGAAHVVGGLLAGVPDLSVIATSRSPLLLPSEQIYLLPVLDVSENGSAVRLFLDRATAVRPDAVLPRATVAELCRHLDGLPLAIELAAARIRTMTVEEISNRLAERFALLRGADRNAPDRHRTLFAVIEWSWDLLDPAAQDAVRRLCRFPAGFTRDAAGTVSGVEGEALDDTLAALVNQSLLTATESGGRMRYRMLEMVREFGEEMIGRSSTATDQATTLSDDIDRAMWRWARDFAAEVESRSEVAVDIDLFAAIGYEVDNLIWVLRRCVEVTEADPADAEATEAVDTTVTVMTVVSVYWIIRGLHGELSGWGERVLRVLPEPPADLDEIMTRRWQTAILASMAHLVIDRDLRGLAIGRTRLRRLRHPDRTYDDAAEFATACALARSRWGAIRYVVRATSSSNRQVRTMALSLRMNLRENFGQLEGALRDGSAVVDLTREHPNVWMSAMTNLGVGRIYGQRGDWDDAILRFRNGVVELAALHAGDDEMQARSLLVSALIAKNELNSAAAAFDELAGGWDGGADDPHGNPEVASGIVLMKAELCAARGDTGAGAYFRRAAELIVRGHPFPAQDPGAMMLVAGSVCGLCRVGEPDSATRYLELLADGFWSTFGDIGWHDQPQAGTMAMAAGRMLAATQRDSDGARLLALSIRLRPRRDYPSLYDTRRDIAELSGVSVAQWDSLMEASANTARRQVVEEILTVLAPYRSSRPPLTPGEIRRAMR